MRWGWRIVAVLVVASGPVLAGCSDAPAADEPAASGVGGILRGVVADAAVRPVAGASVQVLGTAFAATSGEDGTFRFEGLLSGEYQVEVTKLGYAAARQAVPVVAGDPDPPFARFQLLQDLVNTPYFELQSFDGYVEFGFALGAGGRPLMSSSSFTAFTGNNDWRTFHTWDRQPSVVQGEAYWVPESDAARHMAYSWNAFIVGGESAVFEGLSEVNGTSPLMLRHVGDDLATWEIGPERRLETRMTPSTDLAAPAGASYNVHQTFRLFMTSFYGYAPPEGWLFVVDGAHEPRLVAPLPVVPPVPEGNR